MARWAYWMTMAVLLGGCGNDKAWTKTGATLADFQKDVGECERDARRTSRSFGTSLDGAIEVIHRTEDCLVARGYSVQLIEELKKKARADQNSSPASAGR